MVLLSCLGTATLGGCGSQPDMSAKLESEVAESPPNTVLTADKAGTITDRSVVDTSELALLYPSFKTYLAKVPGEESCRKASPHCAKCSSGKTYCSNVPSFTP